MLLFIPLLVTALGFGGLGGSAAGEEEKKKKKLIITHWKPGHIFLEIRHYYMNERKKKKLENRVVTNDLQNTLIKIFYRKHYS